MSNLAERTGALLNIDLHQITREVRVFHMRRRHVTHYIARLQVLVMIKNSLYLITDSIGSDLKVGQVLIRNLELTRRLKSENELFVVYDNLFDAWRAMSRLNPRYKAEEIPAIDALRLEGDELMKISWTLKAKVLDGQLAYTARAWRAIGPHQGVRNEHKVRAVGKVVEATEVKDRRHHFNPGRLPLMYLTVDLALWARIQEASRIGGRMDHRAMVLQLYIDAYTTAVSMTINDLQQLLRPAGVFGDGRTPRKVREAVARIRMSVKPLDNLTARPFVHVFEHVGTDLVLAADLMEEAADNRDPVRMDAAKAFVHRAYRSLVLLQHGRLIHEVLATVAMHVHSKEVLRPEVLSELMVAIADLQGKLSNKEPFTQEPFESGFLNPVLVRILGSLESALRGLENKEDAMKGMKQAHQHLKAAVAPF
jgi:hypothetical protein